MGLRAVFLQVTWLLNEALEVFLENWLKLFLNSKANSLDQWPSKKKTPSLMWPEVFRGREGTEERALLPIVNEILHSNRFPSALSSLGLAPIWMGPKWHLSHQEMPLSHVSSFFLWHIWGSSAMQIPPWAWALSQGPSIHQLWPELCLGLAQPAWGAPSIFYRYRLCGILCLTRRGERTYRIYSKEAPVWIC